MVENGEEKANLIVLVDEEGNEHSFALVDRFPVEMKEYAILVPVTYEEDDEEDPDLSDDAYIFRIDQAEEGNGELLVEVEDETEWNQVAQEWENRIQALEQEDDEEIF